MSRGQKLFVLTLLTLIVMVAVGQFGHHADPGGTTTGGVSDYLAATGSRRSRCRKSGINTLANETGHLRVSINFTWLLLTGFLVLFMQVGFAFLVTGLTRAKNAGHMMMMNLSSFVIALLAYYAVGFAFQFGGVAPDRQHRRRRHRSTAIFAHGNAGVIGLHGFFLQTGNSYDVGVHGVLPVPGRVHGDRRLHHHRRHRRAHHLRRLHLRRDRRWAR